VRLAYAVSSSVVSSPTDPVILQKTRSFLVEAKQKDGAMITASGRSPSLNAAGLQSMWAVIRDLQKQVGQVGDKLESMSQKGTWAVVDPSEELWAKEGKGSCIVGMQTPFIGHAYVIVRLVDPRPRAVQSSSGGCRRHFLW